MKRGRRKPAQLTPRSVKRKKPEPIGIREAVHADGAWTFEIPIATVSELNQREHWRKRYARASAQKELAGMCVNACLPSPVRRAIRFGDHVVTFTRLGGRHMDDDNLASAFKHIRDAFAKAVGVDDDGRRVEWKTEQTPDNKPTRGVRVTIVEREWGEEP